MYNFVIFISDFNFIKKMGNIIFNSFKSMNLVGIVSTHKELEALCKKQKINLIILSEITIEHTTFSTVDAAYQRIGRETYPAYVLEEK